MLIEPGTTLASGERITDLVKPASYEVSRRLYWDREIYDAEMEAIFTRCWVVVGHESEIPNPGDFVVRHIGEDAVIVVRDSKGAVHVNLNSCPHRGMRLCAAEAGNSKTIICPYHGWSFRADGRFLGAPVPQERMHGEIFDKSDLGLTKAHVSIYGGLIFARWASAGPSLEESFGDFKFYLDVIFNRREVGIEVLGPPQRCIIDANWKVIAEQFACDAFHALTAHRSLMDIGFRGKGGNVMERALEQLYSVQACDRGHSVRCTTPYAYRSVAAGEVDPDPLKQLSSRPPPGMSAAQVSEMVGRLSDDQLRLLAHNPPTAGGIFPNSGFLCLYLQRPNGQLVPMMTLKSFVPRGPEKVEFFNWFFVERGASEELKEDMRHAAIHLTGVSGMVEQDDGEVWNEVQRGVRGPIGRRQTSKYQALLGLNRPDDWPGGGQIYAGFNKDDSQWNWWLQWKREMGDRA